MDCMIVGWQWPSTTFSFDKIPVSNKELNGVYSWQIHYLSPVVL